MATQKQIAANRRNAQRSAGPRTPEGKSASSRNSLVTGIYAAAETVLPHEDPKALAALAAEYHAHYQPQSPADRCLVDCLVSDEWLLRRFRRIEGELLTDRVTTITGDTRPIGDAYGMIDTTLERLQRRINATRKSYLKTLEALTALQALQDKQTKSPTPTPAPGPCFPAPIGFVPPPSPEAPPNPVAAAFPSPQCARQ